MKDELWQKDFEILSSAMTMPPLQRSDITEELIYAQEEVLEDKYNSTRRLAVNNSTISRMVLGLERLVSNTINYYPENKPDIDHIHPDYCDAEQYNIRVALKPSLRDINPIFYHCTEATMTMPHLEKIYLLTHCYNEESEDDPFQTKGEFSPEKKDDGLIDWRAWDIQNGLTNAILFSYLHQVRGEWGNAYNSEILRLRPDALHRRAQVIETAMFLARRDMCADVDFIQPGHVQETLQFWCPDDDMDHNKPLRYAMEKLSEDKSIAQLACISYVTWKQGKIAPVFTGVNAKNREFFYKTGQSK